MGRLCKPRFVGSFSTDTPTGDYHKVGWLFMGQPPRYRAAAVQVVGGPTPTRDRHTTCYLRTCFSPIRFSLTLPVSSLPHRTYIASSGVDSTTGHWFLPTTVEIRG